ncbi:hypothetical protein EBO15_14265 [Actinomadura harenae]|uniref:Uncharacterized protein n=1 Tax=Actinomadura harenae TaxID=2483351 RepID=A0A3M2M3B1_9ACTN|nr:hypothetical protein EBO15_14265 [Actinomadura harenae]
MSVYLAVMTSDTLALSPGTCASYTEDRSAAWPFFTVLEKITSAPWSHRSGAWLAAIAGPIFLRMSRPCQTILTLAPESFSYRSTAALITLACGSSCRHIDQ